MARFSHLPGTVLCTPEEDAKVQELRNAEMRATELKERSAVLNANEEALLALKLAHCAEFDYAADMSLVAPSGDVVEAADAVSELLDAVSDATNGPNGVSYEALVKAAHEARNAAEGAVEEITRLRVELEQLPGVVRYCTCCTFCRWKAERARIVPSDHAQQLKVLAAGGPRLVASEPGRTQFEVRSPTSLFHRYESSPTVIENPTIPLAPVYYRPPEVYRPKVRKRKVKSPSSPSKHEPEPEEAALNDEEEADRVCCVPSASLVSGRSNSKGYDEIGLRGDLAPPGRGLFPSALQPVELELKLEPAGPLAQAQAARQEALGKEEAIRAKVERERAKVRVLLLRPFVHLSHNAVKLRTQ